MDEAIARIEAALRRLGAHTEPPAGWERRVLAHTRARAPRRGWWTVPAFALAAAFAFAAPPSAPRELELAVVREVHGPAMRGGDLRGDSAHVGDHLRVTARGGAGPRQLWVYRNEVELVAVCPGSPACGAAGDAVTADLALAALGTYTIVALTSTTPLAPPGGSYDGDLAAAGMAGATIRTRQVDVR